MEVAVLEQQVGELVNQLDEAGYLQLADNDSDALFVALADADEAQRAREVLRPERPLGRRWPSQQPTVAGRAQSAHPASVGAPTRQP